MRNHRAPALPLHSHGEVMRAIYRNLNKAKRDPRRFIWSIATCSATGNSPKLERHSDGSETVYLSNPRAMVKAKSMARIQTKAVREVGAWLVGDVSAPIAGERRAITLNPLPPSRGGRCEVGFYYCRFHNGALEIQEPVNFASLRGVALTPNGAYAIA